MSPADDQEAPGAMLHHVWCNNWASGPVETCMQCARLWAAYPLRAGETERDLQRRYFPHVIRRSGGNG